MIYFSSDNGDCGCGGGFSVKSAPSSCNPNFPTSCESLGSGVIKRIVGEDSASCKYTVPTLSSNSILSYNYLSDYCSFADGSDEYPIFFGNSSNDQSSADSLAKIQGTTSSGQLVALNIKTNSKTQFVGVKPNTGNAVTAGVVEDLIPTQGIVYKSNAGNVQTLSTNQPNKLVSFNNSGDPIIADLPNQFGIPAGMIMAFAGKNGYPGTGWTICNGSFLSSTDFAALFEAIGYTYGQQGTQFAVPNYQGVFIRGAGAQTINGITYGDSFGGPHYDSFQGHIHTTNATLFTPGAPAEGTVASGAFTLTTGAISTPVNDGGNGVPRTGYETRPVNYVAYYYIKT